MIRKYNVAIVEDEDIHVNCLKNMLLRYGSEHDVNLCIDEFRSSEEFLDNKSKFDVVFLDIELPGMNGLDGARRLRETDQDVIIIFVTNMAQFAVHGYEVSALDYIIKPIAYKNFAIKLKRALDIIDKQKKKQLVVFGRDEIYNINVQDIEYLEVRGHHLVFHKTDNTIIDVCGSLSKFEEQLKDSGFSRCNHCYLINMQFIAKINSFIVTLTNGTELQISRRRRKEFVDDFTVYVGSPRRRS